MNISHFNLRNGGGFACRLHILVRRPNGMPGGYAEEVEVADGNDILLGQEKLSDIGYGAYDIPPGSRVRLKARVLAGNDNTSQQTFIYQPGAGTASFVITGTTLDNYLGLMSFPA